MADGSLIETSFGPVATSGFTSAPELYSPVRSHAAVAPTWSRFSRCEEERGVDTPDGTGALIDAHDVAVVSCNRLRCSNCLLSLVIQASASFERRNGKGPGYFVSGCHGPAR